MKGISKSILVLMGGIVLAFTVLISYICYMHIAHGEEILASEYNSRLWSERQRIVRGSVYDRDMNVLAEAVGATPEEQKMIYNGGELFAHTIGYVDPSYGITGLMKEYDQALIGRGVEEGLFGNDKQREHGYDIQTSFNYELQRTAYNALSGYRGAVVVLNPSTGEVLTSVSTPSYNPQNIASDWESINNSEGSVLFNRATSATNPPGSVYKIVTAIAALENLDDAENLVIQDNGGIQFADGNYLPNYGGVAYGPIAMQEAFVKSSNVYFGELGMMLGNDVVKETAEKLYINSSIPYSDVTISQSTHPDVDAGMSGIVAQNAIGQGEVEVTPMQMALIAAAIANDGEMMSPQYVTNILYEGENIETLKNESLGQVMSTSTAQTLRKFMVDTVDRGTGTAANVYNVTVGGKTGTAETGKSVTDSWFVGFAGEGDSQIAFAIMVEEGGTGGSTAANIARQIVQTALNQGLIK